MARTRTRQDYARQGVIADDRIPAVEPPSGFAWYDALTSPWAYAIVGAGLGWWARARWRQR